MASRFGRNKRRQARARIAELEDQRHVLADELDAMRRRANSAERRYSEARADGMNQALRQMKRIEPFEALVRDKLVEQMEPVLRKAAAQVLDAMVSVNSRYYGRSRFTDLDLRPMEPGAGRQDVVLRGRIPAIDWNIVVS